MPAEVKKEIELEIAHVLLIDIIGYSNGRAIWIGDAHRGDGGSNAMFRPKRTLQMIHSCPAWGNS